MYPTAYVLPWQSKTGVVNVFLFNCWGGDVLDVDNTGRYSIHKPLPTLPTPNICTGTSSTGSGVMLMLKPETGYSTEVVFFGGAKRVERGDCRCDAPSVNTVYRMNLSKSIARYSWDIDYMPSMRNMADTVLLPNGNIVILNGVRYGVDSTARDPVLNAWLYMPYKPKGTRFTVLGSSKISRRYHSSAVLLSDGSIFVSGSETGECVAGCKKDYRKFEYKFTAERFYPPYFNKTGRPSIRYLKKYVVKMTETLDIYYTGKVTEVVLMKPSAVTHQNNMGQRGIKLEIIYNKNNKVVVKMPPKGGFVAQPGYYLLFINNGNLPCVKANWLQLQS